MVMINFRILYRAGLLIPVLLLAGLLTGCKSFGPLRIKPVQQIGKAELRPEFTTSYYRVSRDGTYYFYLETTSPARAGRVIRQIALVRVFWRPVPGVTPILPTAINATFRYIVITPTGAGIYSGAGFIRIHNSRHARIMHASIVDGDLLLVSSSGYFHDPLGPARIRGDFHAIRSKAKTISLTLRARREFFLKTYQMRPVQH